MASKYGDPLTLDSWTGWPLRLGRFPAQGKTEGLVAAEDVVLVWSGGKSDVTLHARANQRVERHRFVRHGGMVDFLPKGTTLELVQWQGEPSECVSVSLEARDVARLLGAEVSFEPDALRTAVSDAHVVDLVRRLQQQALAGQPWGSLYVEALSLTIASYVYGRYRAGSAADTGAARLASSEARTIAAFIEEHLGESLSVAQLAAIGGYSPDHFARLFKRSFAQSPYQYILARRVERAKALLDGRSPSIAEVAMICGFGSQAHLHAAFKARTGVTPGMYRRR